VRRHRSILLILQINLNLSSRSGGATPLIINLPTTHIHAPAVLTQVKCPRQSERRLGGPQKRFGRFGEENNLLLLTVLRRRFLGHPARSLVTILTELPHAEVVTVIVAVTWAPFSVRVTRTILVRSCLQLDSDPRPLCLCLTAVSSLQRPLSAKFALQPASRAQMGAEVPVYCFSKLGSILRCCALKYEGALKTSRSNNEKTNV
jgi:hypothetical protein